ncbi:very short patch repair endonuclease [Sphingomonas lenta]|uniref:Very short patch repair endonuclease n=1 Tax=Sphingomonas lenta TaxID=1141887 RepID=A0A2A2SB98_9SPHN|nr:DNA mismatch endonuclease Vsr [Sphingomonas lenta]PAX06528.1 very short patch repair endonuclease [Sphingomonas lenta]
MARTSRPPLTRPEIMARVRGRDTGPEMVIRRTLHAMGYRYRVQARGLPGRPDVAFTRRRAAIFVHGCFWHGHDCARGARAPKANAEFWRAKLDRNRARDAAALDALAALGWRALVVWECGLRDREALAGRLRAFLGPVRVERGG